MLHDLIAAAAWLGVNGCVVWVAWTSTPLFFPEDRSGFARGIHAVILAWTLINAAGILLGAFGLLMPPLYLALVLVSAVAFHWYSRRWPRKVSESPTQFSSVAIASIGVWLIGIALVLGDALIEGIGAFPSDFDALMYHVSLVDHWVQRGNLYAPDAYLWFNPGTNELVSLWIVGPFSGDFLIVLTNLPAFLLLALAASEVGIAFGFSRPAALGLSLLVVLQPVVGSQLRGMGNDMTVAALSLAVLWYVLRAADASERRTPLLFAGLALGLLAGVKYYALGYAAAISVAVVAGLCSRDSFRAAAKGAVAIGLVAIGIGGYWYARNAVVGGSPLHPMNPFQGQKGAAFYPSLWGSTLLLNGDPDLPGLLLQAIITHMGMAHLTALLLAPVAVLGLLIIALVRREARYPAIVLAISLTISLAVWLLTPFASEDLPGTLNQLRWGGYCPARYGMTASAFALVALAAASHRGLGWQWLASLPAWSGRHWLHAVILAGAGLVLLGSQIFAGIGSLRADGIDLALFVINFMLAAFLMSLNWKPILRVTACVLVAGALIGLTAYLSERWHRGYDAFYARMFSSKVFERLEPLPGTEHCTIHEMRYYPFFGSRRQHRVCRPYLVRDTPAFLRHLRDCGATHIVILRRPPPGPAYEWHFDQFRADYPDVCRPVWNDDHFEIYEVNRSAVPR